MMKTMKLFNIAIISFLILSYSCKKEDEGPVTKSASGILENNGALILNEGQFLANNASVSYINEEGKQYDNVFESINGRVMGDVLHSIMETDKYYYLVLNNSGKIEVVNKNTFKSVAVIEGFMSPRYMLNIGGNKALVTNATFETSDIDMDLNVVNLETNKIESSINVNNWCEQMHIKDEFIYVANTGKKACLLINKNDLTIENTISTPSQPYIFAEDASGIIWLLCLGDFVSESPSLLRINPVDNSVESQINLPAGTFVQRMQASEDAMHIYVLADKLYKLGISETDFSAAQIVPGTELLTSPYGLGIDKENGDIYLGDAKDFASSGMVKILDKNGTEKASFSVGVNPNTFVFR